MILTFHEFAATKLDQRVRMIQVIRFFIAVAFLLGTLVFQTGDPEDKKVFILLVYTSLSYFLYASLLIFVYLFKLIPISKSYTILQLVFDFLFFTLFLVATAGVNSEFKYLYWLLIFYTGVLFDLEGAVLSAVFAGFLFSAMANFHFVLEQFPQLQFLNELVVLEKDIRIMTILTNCFGFILFGAVAAFIGRLLHRAEYENFLKVEQVQSLQNKISQSEKFVAMGQMAARIAHEIRNPLTSISASIEMLKADLEDQQKKDQLLTIASKEVLRLNTLIDDFLHFAKQEEPELQKHQLSELIQQTISLFKNGHPEIELKYQNNLIHEKPLMLEEAKFSQLIWNVLNNASDAMKGSGTIEINIKEDPYHYEIEILDQGEGLSNSLEDPFSPFATTKNKGTGLGLSIVKRIADQLQATIDLSNRKQSKGCIFRIQFQKQGQR